MTEIAALHVQLIETARDGNGQAPRALRRSAFDNSGLDEPIRTLVDKVAKQAFAVTDADFAAVRSAGLSEDQIYEVVICAAIGQANRQYEQALSALDVAMTGR